MTEQEDNRDTVKIHGILRASAEGNPDVNLAMKLQDDEQAMKYSDCWSCPTHDAILDFAKERYAALTRRAVHQLQRIKASGVYVRRLQRLPDDRPDHSGWIGIELLRLYGLNSVARAETMIQSDSIDRLIQALSANLTTVRRLQFPLITKRSRSRELTNRNKPPSASKSYR